MVAMVVFVQDSRVTDLWLKKKGKEKKIIYFYNHIITMQYKNCYIPWELLRYSISTLLAPRPGLMFNNGPRIVFSCEYIYLLRKKVHID